MFLNLSVNTIRLIISILLFIIVLDLLCVRNTSKRFSGVGGGGGGGLPMLLQDLCFTGKKSLCSSADAAHVNLASTHAPLKLKQYSKKISVYVSVIYSLEQMFPKLLALGSADAKRTRTYFLGPIYLGLPR